MGRAPRENQCPPPPLFNCSSLYRAPSRLWSVASALGKAWALAARGSGQKPHSKGLQGRGPAAPGCEEHEYAAQRRNRACSESAAWLPQHPVPGRGNDRARVFGEVALPRARVGIGRRLWERGQESPLCLGLRPQDQQLRHWARDSLA